MMAENKTPAVSGVDGVVSLWPTHFLQRQMPDSASANKALLELILQLEAEHHQKPSGKDHTTDYLTQDFLTHEHPVVDWLKQCINKSMSEYLKHSRIGYPVDWGLQAWANINRRGDYHNLHNHPHSYLSGTYYVAMPSANEFDTGSRTDLNPGAISFYDPRAQANMLSIRDDAQVEAEHRVLPDAGTLLLWPSFLHHFVHPNNSDSLRVSVSFNVVLKWRDDYLPM